MHVCILVDDQKLPESHSASQPRQAERDFRTRRNFPLSLTVFNCDSV